MSEEKRVYEQILATLESRSDEINKAFTDRAGDDSEIIDLAHMGDLINDLSVIFNADLEEAKDFISYDNDSVSKYFDLDNINFNDFMELIKMWLQKKISGVQSQTAINQGEEEREGEGNNILGNETERNNEESHTLIPPNTYRVNREILDELLMRHKAHLQVKFYQLRHPDIEAITLKDYFTFLQDCFMLDGLVLYENPSDTQDLFTRDDYQEKLTEIVNKYHDEVKGTRHTIDEEELLLTFNECFDIIDYWFQTDENVTLVNPKKKASAAVNQSVDGQSHVKALLLETIEKYQEMVKEASTEVEKQILQGTIDTLYEKLNKLEEGPKNLDDESRILQDAKIQKKKEEKRIKALLDIFDFYSKQQLNAGKAQTFDRIEKQFTSINLGKLSIIIKNFQMKIDQFKLKETFKKVAKSEFITFEEFCDLFQKISKDAELIKDPKVVKPNYEKMKEYKPDSYKTSPVPKSLGKIDFKKAEKRKTDSEKTEEMWDHMGLYNNQYKNNLNTVQLAFNSQDKETFRIPPDSINYKLKVRGLEGKSPEEIKEAIFQRNEMRKAVRDVKLIEKSLLKNYRDPSTGKQTSRREHSISERREDSTYATIMANKPRANLPEKKLTLNQVQKYKQSEIKTIGAEDRFDPRDLIDENDDEDNMYLAEYNIISDPKINEQPIQETAEIFEETVKLETNIRKAKPIPGKYSRMPATKSKTRIERIGTGPTHQLAEINTDKKPMTLNDIEYRSPMPVTASSNHSEFKRPQLGVSQSVKAGLGVSKHLASIHEYSSKNLDQSHHGVTRSIQMPTGMSYEASQFDPRRAASNVVLNRAYQIQEEALRRENAMMANLLSMQNNKIEKGLRVARK